MNPLNLIHSVMAFYKAAISVSAPSPVVLLETFILLTNMVPSLDSASVSLQSVQHQLRALLTDIERTVDDIQPLLTQFQEDRLDFPNIISILDNEDRLDSIPVVNLPHHLEALAAETPDGDLLLPALRKFQSDLESYNLFITYSIDEERRERLDASEWHFLDGMLHVRNQRLARLREDIVELISTITGEPEAATSPEGSIEEHVGERYRNQRRQAWKRHFADYLLFYRLRKYIEIMAQALPELLIFSS